MPKTTILNIRLDTFTLVKTNERCPNVLHVTHIILPCAHACHESHKRSGALKTGIRCCERLSLLQSLLQSPLDFEAGRSIEGKESRSVEKAEGTREGGAMGRRKQGWKTNFSIMTEHFPCLVRFAPSSNDDPAYLQLHLTYRAFNRDHGRENSFAVEST